MKRHAVLFALVTVNLCSAAHSGQLTKQELPQSPLQVMMQLSARSGKGDPQFYRDYVDDRFMGTTVIGSRKTSFDRNYIIKTWGARDSGGGTSEVSAHQVVQSKDTAVIRATITDTAKDVKGTSIKVQTWVTDVYVLRQKKWRLLSSMEVVVPPKQTESDSVQSKNLQPKMTSSNFRKGVE